MASGIEETLTTLYEMVQDAWSLPLGAEKCVIERDKVLDLLDEISNQLPGELKQAKTIVESRNEVITNAKREAENILKQAEQRARQMISREEVYKQAEQEADELMKNAQAKIKELRQVTNDYVDDSMKRTEDAIAQMDLLGHNFFVFRDAQTEQICVVYKRTAGAYGLLEFDG